MTLDIPSQYMQYCLVVLCEVYYLCYCVRARDHCCVLYDVTQDFLFTWYIVHQPLQSNLSTKANLGTEESGCYGEGGYHKEVGVENETFFR